MMFDIVNKKELNIWRNEHLQKGYSLRSIKGKVGNEDNVNIAWRCVETKEEFFIKWGENSCKENDAKPIIRTAYKEQLEKWVNGESIHNNKNGADECCPDFSCCNPTINTPIEIRRKFAKACYEGDHDIKMSMCMDFLGNIMVNEGCEVEPTISVLHVITPEQSIERKYTNPN